MEISILGFFLMLGASCLGFSIAWLLQKEKFQPLRALLQKNERAYQRLREEYDTLVKHSNELRTEKSKYQEKLASLIGKNQQRSDSIRQLERDKEFIFKEFENYRREVKEKLDASRNVLSSFEELKEKNQKVKLKTDKWRIKYYQLADRLQAAETTLRQLKKERDHLKEKLKNAKPDSNSVFEWESNYKELKLRYLALAREKKDMEQKIHDFEIEIKKGDEMVKALEQLQAEAEKLKTENKALSDQVLKFAQYDGYEEKEVILSRIGRKKDKVDFRRIGKASPTHKDNLQLIKGIGPFIEQKLNALGIFHFNQIAHFKEDDINEINHIIELAPGHIKMDDWVGQAARMK